MPNAKDENPILEFWIKEKKYENKIKIPLMYTNVIKIAANVIFIDTKNVNNETTIIKIHAPIEAGLMWRGREKIASLKNLNERKLMI